MLTPSDLIRFMDKFGISQKRLAVYAGVSRPALRGWLTGSGPEIPEDAQGRAEAFLRSLKGNPVYDAHFQAIIRDDAARASDREAMQVAADAMRGTIKLDSNIDGNPTYVRPAKSAEATRAGEDVLKGVRYGHS